MVLDNGPERWMWRKHMLLLLTRELVEMKWFGVDLLSARYRGSVFRAWKRLMTFAMGPECRLCGRGGFGRSMAEASRPRDRSYSRSLKSVGYHH